MSTPLFIFLLVLMLVSMAVLGVNLAGPKKWLYDYWSLDDEDDTPPSKLDFLRSAWAFYGAGAVLVGSYGAYLILEH